MLPRRLPHRWLQTAFTVSRKRIKAMRVESRRSTFKWVRHSREFIDPLSYLIHTPVSIFHASRNLFMHGNIICVFQSATRFPYICIILENVTFQVICQILFYKYSFSNQKFCLKNCILMTLFFHSNLPLVIQLSVYTSFFRDTSYIEAIFLKE